LISNHFRDSVGGPEKAGVGGSIPSLATHLLNNRAIAKTFKFLSREQYYISDLHEFEPQAEGHYGRLHALND
jgi:hypothetical protein